MGTLVGRLGKLALVNPRGLREVTGTALALTEGLTDPEIDVGALSSVSLFDLCPDGAISVNANFTIFPSERFSITPMEAICLGLLIKKCSAKRVFEFGTHRGVSTTQLASNIPEDGRVFTLDLPRDNTKTHFNLEADADAKQAELEVANFPKKGDFIPEALRSKITFLQQDSALFDPTPYASSIDFVFVDAAHTSAYVKNDSEKAWLMLRPGGIVAWHDCRAESPDVVKYLRACKYNPRRIDVANNTIAFAEKPAGA